MMHFARRACIFAVMAVPVLWFAASGSVRAHEIPRNVIVQAWVVPDGQQLDLFVRVPLEAMRDVAIPLRGPGYIDLAAAGDSLRDAAETWVANQVDVYEDAQPLENFRIHDVRLALPSDRAFRSHERLRAHFAAPPLNPALELYAAQALLDVHIVYAIRSAAADFSIYPEFRRLGRATTTVIRFKPPAGGERLFEFSGDPGLVHLDPRWHHAFARFIKHGFEHILDGTDHLLFVLCLILPFRRVRPLIAMVTAFTAGHSVTLIGSAFGLTPSVIWFPTLIEALIAASIVYMALENIFGSRWQRRWLVAFGFGLVHGFGFSFALAQTLQFAGGHVLTSLLAFNLGVELGQLLIVAIAVPLLVLLFRAGLPERLGTLVISAILAHSGWHWMSDRVTDLAAYSFSWPVLDGAFAAAGLRWLMLAIVIGVLLRVLYVLYARLMARDQMRPP